MTDAPIETEDHMTTEDRNKPPPARQGRIIVRNLVFDIREKHLEKEFKKYGKIESINIPLNQANN